MLPKGSVISGFISKIINDVVDISKDKIKEADKNRKSKSQNIQTRIYQVIIDAINELTNNRYKGQDKLYDTAEILLNELKSGNNNLIEHIRDSLRNLSPLIDYDTCERFIEILRCEIEKEENFDLYKEILLVLLEDATKYTQSELQQIKLQLEEINEKLNGNVKNRENQSVGMCQNIKSRTQDYVDKWNANMFLNDFDEWDEKAGVNVKLSDVYLKDLLPCFKWKENKQDMDSLDYLLSKYILRNYKKKMLLILGQPGIGKSTLITWITANFDSKIENILVYQFASDLKNVNWKSEGILKALLKELKLSYNTLEDKILILDGFDEICVKEKREVILNQLYWELEKEYSIKKFSLIITCRENYIHKLKKVECDYITLQSWDFAQIQIFCEVYQKKSNSFITEKTKENIYKNRDVLGIPLILYIVLSLEINIEKESSIVDVYDKIFSLDGGIYDRCIDNKRYANITRISKIKEQIHQISREMAMWMFEHKPVEAYIPYKEYQRICDTIKNNMKENGDIEQDFLIRNFLKLRHCEKNEEELYFVHRTIYEYFVVEYIFRSIYEVIDLPKEVLAGVFGRFLKGNILSHNILEYLKMKILNSKLRDDFENVNEAFQVMLRDGMTYYTGICYKNVIDCEMNIFANMLEVIHLWGERCLKYSDLIYKYIQYNRNLKLNLKNIVVFGFEKEQLSGVYLANADLRNTNLLGRDKKTMEFESDGFFRANLSGAKMQNLCLKEIDLSNADLSGADLSGADLSGANLLFSNLSNTNLSHANLFGTIFDESQICFISDLSQIQKIQIYNVKQRKLLTFDEYFESK